MPQTPYNISAISQNTTGLFTFVRGVNDTLVGGYLGLFFMIGLSVVLISNFYLMTRDIMQSLFATSWIIFLLSFPLTAIGLLNGGVWIFAMVIALITLVFTWPRG